MKSSGTLDVSYNVITQHSLRRKDPLDDMGIREEDDKQCETQSRHLDLDAVINGFKQSCSLVDQ